MVTLEAPVLVTALEQLVGELKLLVRNYEHRRCTNPTLVGMMEFFLIERCFRINTCVKIESLKIQMKFCFLKIKRSQILNLICNQ